MNEYLSEQKKRAGRRHSVQKDETDERGENKGLKELQYNRNYSAVATACTLGVLTRLQIA